MKKKNYLAQKQQIKWRTAIIVFSIAAIAGVLLFLFYNLGLPGDSKGAPGKNGSKTVSSGTVIVNEYTTLTSNAAVAATQIIVAANSLNANGRFSGNLAAGDLIMIIQMHGATITTTNTSSYGAITSYNNCGNYEFAEVSSLTSTTKINLTTGLKKAYDASGEVQVVRVPRYTTLTVSSGAKITADAWDGTKGGIVALEVSGTSTINGTIDVSGLGFNGGGLDNSSNTNITSYVSSSSGDGGEKGEGIFGNQADYAASTGKYGRGAPANGGGGGNAHNAGGGGGANAGTGTWNGGGIPDVSGTNYTTAWNLEGGSFASNNSPGGGRGGYGWSLYNGNPITLPPGNATWSGDNRPIVGGLGGRILDYSGGRIFMGGGGGAADANNNTGTAGGDGGGIVFILAGGNITGTGSIKANGNAAANTATTSNGDGAGGGGGGGTVIVYQKNSSISNMTIEAKGGNGGNHVILSTYSPETEGPGGGGGGGYIALTSSSSMTLSVAGGVNGTTNSNVFTTFLPNGATKGGAGISNGTAPANPYSGTSTLPVELLNFRAKTAGESVILDWSVASEKNNDFYTIRRRTNDGSESEVCKVKAQDWKGGILNYSAIDNNPSGTEIYYTLSQTDLDGTTADLATAHVSFTKQLTGLTIDAIGPNPFDNELRVSLKSPGVSTILMSLYALNGQLIEEKTYTIDAGTTTLNYFPEKVNSGGSYLIVVKSGNKLIGSRKIIKK